MKPQTIKISARAAEELCSWAWAVDEDAKGEFAASGADEFVAQTRGVKTRTAAVALTPAVRAWLVSGGEHSDPMTAAKILEEWIADGALSAMSPRLNNRTAAKLAAELRAVYAAACD